LKYSLQDLIDYKFGKFYSILFDLRQEGDYQVFVKFEEGEIAPLLEEIKTFQAALKSLIQVY
jgi:uncharacterized protein (UPF0332 family)